VPRDRRRDESYLGIELIAKIPGQGLTINSKGQGPPDRSVIERWLLAAHTETVPVRSWKNVQVFSIPLLQRAQATDWNPTYEINLTGVIATYGNLQLRL
jgi:hypothetical protein